MFKFWKTVKIPSLPNQNDIQVEMSADLALQIQLKQVMSGKIAAARIRADLHVRDGRWSLDVASPATCYKGMPFPSLPRYQIRWGDISVDTLLAGLRERGLHDIHVVEEAEHDDAEAMDVADSKAVVIEIKSPNRARIEVSPSNINVHTNEPSVRRLIADVVNSALNVL